MKSIIIAMLAKAGINLTAEQTTELESTVSENYVLRTDYDAEVKGYKDTIAQHEGAIGNLNTQLKGFEGVDVSKLQTTIDTLGKELTTTRKGYATEKQIKGFEVEKDGVKYKINNPATFSRLIAGDIESLDYDEKTKTVRGLENVFTREWDNDHTLFAAIDDGQNGGGDNQTQSTAKILGMQQSKGTKPVGTQTKMSEMESTVNEIFGIK